MHCIWCTFLKCAFHDDDDDDDDDDDEDGDDNDDQMQKEIPHCHCPPPLQATRGVVPAEMPFKDGS